MADYDTLDGVRKVCARILAAFLKHGRVSVVVRAGKRSLDQNAVQHVWYAQIAAASGALAVEVQREAKLLCGCPILCAEDEAFAHFYALAIEPLDYEDRKQAMDYLAVTRLMTPAQMTQYLHDVRFFYRHVVQLEFLAERVEADRDERLADER